MKDDGPLTPTEETEEDERGDGFDSTCSVCGAPCRWNVCRRCSAEMTGPQAVELCMLRRPQRLHTFAGGGRFGLRHLALTG